MRNRLCKSAIGNRESAMVAEGSASRVVKRETANVKGLGSFEINLRFAPPEIYCRLPIIARPFTIHDCRFTA